MLWLRDHPEVSIHALLAECDLWLEFAFSAMSGFNPRTPCGVRRPRSEVQGWKSPFQSTHSLRSATRLSLYNGFSGMVSIHALLAECDFRNCKIKLHNQRFNPRTPCGVRPATVQEAANAVQFQSTHSLRSATGIPRKPASLFPVSIHALLAECDVADRHFSYSSAGFNPRTPCGVRRRQCRQPEPVERFQSTHSLRSATAPDLIHGYSTEQIILCANLPKKTVIARLLFLSIYLSIFYSQCITPIADLPGNSCELEVGAQAMFNSL